LPHAGQEGQRLKGEVDKALAEPEALKNQDRLRNLTLWRTENVKNSKKGSRSHSYWMAFWREGDEVRNVQLGICRKIDLRPLCRRPGS
jgi:hypothetical protein